MFKRVFFDICAGCNARCPWCQTGNKTRQGQPLPKGAIAPEDFARALDYMFSTEMINQKTVVELYNFAEPFLHPQFQEIIKCMAHSGLRFALSTNASCLKTFSEPVLDRLAYITFSMPGFSQGSYDRIHGFNFETIKSNIVAILKNFRECGFHGHPYISYHVYQFNTEELEDACKFAADNDLGLEAPYALFNDGKWTVSYLDGTMPYEQLRRAGQDLMLHYVNELLAQQPANFVCPQHDILTLNERCEVLLCCGVSKNEGPGILGSLFEMNVEGIQHLKQEHPLCRRCLASGAAYWGHHPVYRRRLKRTFAVHAGTMGDVGSVSFVEEPSVCAGAFESISRAGTGILLVQGWARDPVNDCPIDEILVVDDNRKVLASSRIPPSEEEGHGGRSFWQVRVDLRHASPGNRHLVGYAFDRAKRIAYRLANGVDLK